MTRHPRMVPLALLAILACDRPAPRTGPEPSPYLYVWAGAEREGDSDFLAVIDADTASPRYGEIVATAPVGLRGMAHHSEHVMPRGDTLFVNAFRAGATFLINLADPLHPIVADSFRAMGGFTYPHTFERLPNGNVLATFQNTGEGNRLPGGLVELSPAGRLVRAMAAADTADPELRPYSVTPIPALDRAVSTTTDMREEAHGTSFQVWRLSDLTLLHTVRLTPGPAGTEHRDPAEVRLLADSTTAIMTTFTCAMWLLRGLDTDAPHAELVASLPWTSYQVGDCSIPVTRGRYWILPHALGDSSEIVTFDVSDPSHPAILHRLMLPGRWWPHWLSLEPGGNRLALTSGTGETLYRVLIFRLDPASGRLTLDSTFRDPGASEPGVRFDRADWPHGAAGPARPHGTVFSRP